MRMTNPFLKSLVIGSGCLLSACALPSTVWQKDGVSQKQYNIDNTKCENDTASVNFGGGGATAGGNRKGYYEDCMKSLGYHKEGEKEKKSKNAPDGILDPRS